MSFARVKKPKEFEPLVSNVYNEIISALNLFFHLCVGISYK